MTEQDLSELKEKYEELRKEHNLPEFSELNEFFDVEEVEYETDFLLRKVRRHISEKISGYLRFVEMILNPNNAPMFLFKYIKKLNQKDKDKLKKLQGSLGKFSLDLVKLDLEYDAKAESDFINETFESFKKIKKELFGIVNKMLDNEDKKERANGSYFG